MHLARVFTCILLARGGIHMNPKFIKNLGRSEMAKTICVSAQLGPFWVSGRLGPLFGSPGAPPESRTQSETSAENTIFQLTLEWVGWGEWRSRNTCWCV